MHKPGEQQSSELNSGQQDSGHHNLLHIAFAKLQDRQLALEQVRRVAVERQGAIHIEVHEAGTQRFFVYEANELRELQPESDQ